MVGVIKLGSREVRTVDLLLQNNGREAIWRWREKCKKKGGRVKPECPLPSTNPIFVKPECPLESMSALASEPVSEAGMLLKTRR